MRKYFHDLANNKMPFGFKKFAKKIKLQLRMRSLFFFSRQLFLILTYEYDAKSNFLICKLADRIIDKQAIEIVRSDSHYRPSIRRS